MEEKVYSRSVNKIHLAARVVDQKVVERTFTSQELSDIMIQDTWVQCDVCNKWRMLPPKENAENLPEKWYCNMNVNDFIRSRCSAQERDAKWYAEYFRRKTDGTNNIEAANEDTQIENESRNAQHTGNNAKIESTKRDAVLTSLLAGSVTNNQTSLNKKTEKHETCPTTLISKYYFHDSLSKFSSRKVAAI